jgi:bacterioferritin-associated ferredoxin
MYVCICNAFTEKQVIAALDGGASTAAGVYRHMGCTPQCGKCVPSLRTMVKEYPELWTAMGASDRQQAVLVGD